VASRLNETMKMNQKINLEQHFSKFQKHIPKAHGSLSQPEILIKYQTVIPIKINHHRHDNIKKQTIKMKFLSE